MRALTEDGTATLLWVYSSTKTISAVKTHQTELLIYSSQRHLKHLGETQQQFKSRTTVSFLGDWRIECNDFVRYCHGQPISKIGSK